MVWCFRECQLKKKKSLKSTEARGLFGKTAKGRTFINSQGHFLS